MAEFERDEQADLSQAGQTTASTLNKKRKSIQKKLHNKRKQAKKAKEKTEKTAKRTKKIVVAVCSSTVGLAIVAVILVAVILITVVSVAAASESSGGVSTGAYSDTRERIVQLAREQKGNSGERYWNEMVGGPTEWCSYYAQ